MDPALASLITDAITAQVTRRRPMKVASRAVGADLLLVGALRVDGHRMEVTATLTRAQIYSRHMDVFVAAAVRDLVDGFDGAMMDIAIPEEPRPTSIWEHLADAV